MIDHCNQKGCDAPAACRFTWPGRDEAGICEGHVSKLRAVADAMGLYLQLIPISAGADAESDAGLRTDDG